MSLPRQLFRGWLAAVAKRQPAQALHDLLQLRDDITRQIDDMAIRYDGGVHVKHRLTRYHDFFIERIRAGERVLDLGCGIGFLAYDIVTRTDAVVTGIDLDAHNLLVARQRFQHPKLTLILGDALACLPSRHFDVVILSNILEHIEQRVAFLRDVQRLVRPERLLIRVPMIDRHWLVPLRKELGLSYFSDPGHYTEYTEQSFGEELQQADLAVTHRQINWGEIWAEAQPRQPGTIP